MKADAQDLIDCLAGSAGYPTKVSGGWITAGADSPVVTGISGEVFQHESVYNDQETSHLLHTIMELAGEIYHMSLDPNDDLSFLDVENAPPKKMTMVPPGNGPFPDTTEGWMAAKTKVKMEAEKSAQALAEEVQSEQIPVSLGAADMFGQQIMGSNQIYTYIAADHDCLMRAAYAYSGGTLSVRLAIKGDTGFTVATRKHLKAVGFSVYDDYASIHMTVGDDLILARKALGSALFAAHAWGEVGFEFLPAIPVTNTPDISNTPKAQDFVDDVEDF